MTKEDLLQDWLPRLMSAIKDVRNKELGSAEETIYELYVEMNQQTLSEKVSTFSEITLEDQMSAMAIELMAAQKRVADLENGICQRDFEAKQEQKRPQNCGTSYCSCIECVMEQERGETKDTYDDPCPDCGKQLQVARGGGVKCSCGYWFCF